VGTPARLTGQHFSAVRLRALRPVYDSAEPPRWPVPDQEISRRGLIHSRWATALTLLLLTAAAYVPCVNNGFISDDFVALHNVETVKLTPHHLVESPGDLFRMTSYLMFGILKKLFGFDYRAFYAFNICLHLLNVLLLRQLVAQLSGSDVAGFLAGALFAVFQAPQEAVMWLAAMNETLQGFFLLSTVLLWTERRRGFALITYSLALLSKESAPVMLLILPLIDRSDHQRGLLKRYALLLVPTAIFAVAFLYTAPNHSMIRNGTYAPSLHALSVFLRSMHRLLWPWAYVLLFVLWSANGRAPEGRLIAKGLVAIGMMLLPYTFLTYANAIPSRQVYLASAVLVSILAAGVLAVSSRRLQIAWVLAFVVFNVGYMWVRKDAQMEERAAPTTALMEELKRHTPGHVIISKFPYPHPGIAKGVASLVPGWQWDFVEFSTAQTNCSDCLWLEWDSVQRGYRQLETKAIISR
jgi:hypothetical protein